MGKIAHGVVKLQKKNNIASIKFDAFLHGFEVLYANQQVKICMKCYKKVRLVQNNFTEDSMYLLVRIENERKSITLFCIKTTALLCVENK